MLLKVNILWCFNILFVLPFIIMVKSLNIDTLKGIYPVYGLASIADRKNGSQCFQELAEFKDAVDNGKVWGLKVLDSSGSPSTGFLYGNNVWIGSHKQCTDIKNQKQFDIRHDKVNHTVTPYDFPPFEFGFAVVMMRHSNNVQYRLRIPLDYIVQLGLCIPKSCSGHDISKLSKEYFSSRSLEFQKDFQLDLKVTEVRMIKEDLIWILKLPKTIALCTIVTAVLVLTIIGTILDIKRNKNNQNLVQGNNAFLHGKLNASTDSFSSVKFIPNPDNKSIIRNIFICFSLHSNVKALFKMKSSADGLPVIQGVKFLSMVWIIFAHTVFFQSDFARNPAMASRLENFFTQVISNATFSVDTFLFLSGFLMAYCFFKKFNPHNNLERRNGFLTNVKIFLLLHARRILRFTPVYVITILLSNVIYTFYDKESSIYVSERLPTNCDKYWWRNVLYINNFFLRSEMCLTWSWYLSLDLQFFAIGTFLLMLSIAYFKLAAFLTFLMLLIQITVTAYISYSIGYTLNLDDQLEYMDQVYHRPWIRIGPYLIGLITGYLLVIQLKHKMDLGKKTKFILWCLFPLVNLWILFGLYTKPLSVGFTTFYVCCTRSLWGVGLGWLVVTLLTGNAGYIHKFLSYKIWIPLGRLTFCAYLLHPLIITALALASEGAIDVSIGQELLNCHGAILMSVVASMAYSVIFESPIIAIIGLLFKNPTVNQNSSKEQVNSGDNQSTASSNLSITKF